MDTGKSVLVLNYTDRNKKVNTSNNFPLIHRLFGYQDPSIDYSQPFLSKVTGNVNHSGYISYQIDLPYKNSKGYKDLILNNKGSIDPQPDYVIIELPNLLESRYPSDLVSNSDMAILVCRSNRLWSSADDNLLNKLKELSISNLQFIINGVEIKEVESLLGELPKNRSNFRRQIKNTLRFQFYSKSQI